MYVFSSLLAISSILIFIAVCIVAHFTAALLIPIAAFFALVAYMALKG
jgi:hypothetical protein